MSSERDHTATSETDAPASARSDRTSSLFDALANGHRRETVRFLLGRTGAVAVSDIADHLSSSDGTAAAERWPNIEALLVHWHLPKLAESGLVAYDREGGTVRPTGPTARARPLLDRTGAP